MKGLLLTESVSLQHRLRHHLARDNYTTRRNYIWFGHFKVGIISSSASSGLSPSLDLCLDLKLLLKLDPLMLCISSDDPANEVAAYPLVVVVGNKLLFDLLQSIDVLVIAR